MISYQNCQTRSLISSLLHLFWNSKIQQGNTRLFSFCSNILIQYIEPVYKKSQRCHFLAIWLISLNRPWNLIGRHVLIKLGEKCHKMMLFDKKNYTGKSQTDCKDHKWFENGCNKGCYWARSFKLVKRIARGWLEITSTINPSLSEKQMKSNW